MKDAVIVEYARTAFGKYGGGLKDVRPDDMAAHVIAAVLERSKVDPALVEDVILGCANQAGEDNRNVARMAVLLAGLPTDVAGGTVNRLCGSGLMAVNDACRAIIAGEGDCFIAGGVESMTRAPFVMGKAEEAFPREQKIFDTTLGWRFTNKKLADKYYPFSMGETAENVAEKYGVAREDQDAFALQSQTRYAQAQEQGAFKQEIVPYPLEKKGAKRGEPPKIDYFSVDEHPRLGVTGEDLKKLKPVFREGGSVTAGNSSGINDGACALLIMSGDLAKKLNLKPLARYVASAVAGVDPACMGVGPVPATKKAMARAGLNIDALDLIELNEAFAAQALACVRDLGLDQAKVNVNGGAIALGHPLGASGARILGHLALQLSNKNLRYGLATMCIGVGQGIATIIERVSN